MRSENPPEDTSSPLTWDFTRSRDISLVPWPRDQMGSLSCSRDVNGSVIVRFTESRTFQGVIERVGFTQYGGKVVNVELSFPKQTLDDVVKSADAIATDWSLKKEKIERWQADARARGYRAGRLSITKADATPQLTLEIVKSFNKEQPYAIEFQVGWVKETAAAMQNPLEGEMKYDWDFSQGHDVTTVSWPKEKRPNPDPFYDLTLEREVRVKITPEREFRSYVRRVTF